MHADYESIAKQHRLYYGEGERHLRIYRRLYADRTHFVYELIQNADDTGSKNLILILCESDLLVWNDGRRFNEPDTSGRLKNDVRDICSIGLSEKELTQIGTFGIGFKAVYAYTDTPEIYSGHESFRIRRLVEPEAIESLPTEIAQWVAAGKTVFRLPFKQGLRSDEIDQLSLRLSNLDKWTLLFLSSLEAIRWRDERSGASGSYASDRERHGAATHAWQVNLKKETRGGQDSADSFLVFPKQGVKPPSNVIEELLQQAEEAEDRDRIQRSAYDDQVVEVAFRVRDGQLVATDGCVLFAYLPTAKETHLRFLIQARYQTTPARDNIPTDSAWNQWLIEETANFLSFVLSQIKDAELLEPGLRLYRLEPRLQSHYKPDLILQDKDGRYVAVEVEPDFPGDNDTGVWRAAAYKHVLAAELKLPCDQVRGFLVAPRIPDGIKQKCRHLGVEPFELGEGPAAAGDPTKST